MKIQPALVGMFASFFFVRYARCSMALEPRGPEGDCRSSLVPMVNEQINDDVVVLK